MPPVTRSQSKYVARINNVEKKTDKEIHNDCYITREWFIKLIKNSLYDVKNLYDEKTKKEAELKIIKNSKKPNLVDKYKLERECRIIQYNVICASTQLFNNIFLYYPRVHNKIYFHELRTIILKKIQELSIEIIEMPYKAFSHEEKVIIKNFINAIEETEKVIYRYHNRTRNQFPVNYIGLDIIEPIASDDENDELRYDYDAMTKSFYPIYDEHKYGDVWRDTKLKSDPTYEPEEYSDSDEDCSDLEDECTCIDS